MNRQIKFRFWNPVDMEMLADVAGYDGADINDMFLSLNDDDYVVMQYTGLKDKNGNPIFEGDIVQWIHLTHGKIQSEVKYQAGCFCHFPNWSGASWGNLNRVVQSCEVIGNIYENPELLEKK